MAARPAAHPDRYVPVTPAAPGRTGTPALRRMARHRGRVAAVAVAAAVLLAGCSDDGGDETAAGTTPTTAGPPSDLTTTTTAYVVPEIPSGSVAEICGGAAQIVAADQQVSELLTPLLGADSTDESDRALLVALGQVRPFVDSAGAGYDRMAAVLPVELAADAGVVRDATSAFYDKLAAATTIDVLIEVIGDTTILTAETSAAAARLDATTRKTCNTSLYGDA